MHRFHYFIISACMLFTSCNKDEVITEEVGGQPIIELDSETGIYTVKVDHELTIAPTYQNVEDALFAWTIDGTLVSSCQTKSRQCGRLCRRGTESRSERTHPSGHLTGTTFAGAKSRPEYRLHIYSRYSAFGCRRVQNRMGTGRKNRFHREYLYFQ